MTWVVKHDGNVAGRVASFPELTWTDPPPFVRVTIGSERAELRSTVRRGASGDEIRLAPECFATTPDGTPCGVEASRARAYRSFWLIRDPARKRALLGLAIAFAGIVIDAALALGKIYPLVVVGDAGMAATTVAGFVLTTGGLLVTFYGVYSSSD